MFLLLLTKHSLKVQTIYRSLSTIKLPSLSDQWPPSALPCPSSAGLIKTDKVENLPEGWKLVAKPNSHNNEYDMMGQT